MYDSPTYARLAQLRKEYCEVHPSEVSYANWMYAASLANLDNYLNRRLTTIDQTNWPNLTLDRGRDIFPPENSKRGPHEGAGVWSVCRSIHSAETRKVMRYHHQRWGDKRHRLSSRSSGTGETVPLCQYRRNVRRRSASAAQGSDQKNGYIHGDVRT